MRPSLRIALALLPLALAACKGDRADWGMGAIDSMVTPPDPPLTCGQVLDPSPQAAARAACTFGTGARAADTLGVTPAVGGSLPVRHVVILMKENRSYDHVLGLLSQRGQPAAEAIPATWTNPDLAGVEVSPFRADTTCLTPDPGHQWASMVTGVAGGEMNGFVINAAQTTDTDGHYVMAHFDEPDLPFYYWLARTFALSDRHFAPIAAGTYANRNFLHFGSNLGVYDTGIQFASPSTPSIMHTLMAAGYTWRVYSDGLLLSGTLDWAQGDPGVRGMGDFLADLDAGTLPNVAFVDGEGAEDEHPDADIQIGEAWTRSVYERAAASPQWDRLAMIWTYDEGGGFADHVPPPPACSVDANDPLSDAYGVRVPLAVISPWARRGFVGHTPTDHTAITRFIEVLFDLPALTARDANSDALLELFDFSCGRDLTPPASPPAGTGGCVP